MPSNTDITVAQLFRLVGLPNSPAIIDVRTEEDFAADPRILPAGLRRDWARTLEWAGSLADNRIVVVCQRGQKLSEGVAALLRAQGQAAEVLEGGFEAWRDAGLPLVSTGKLPARDAKGSTVWVTRARPKIDRIACPWLIRRFVDASAVFLYVAAAEVKAVAERFGATPFDIDDTFWSHRGETCTFDTMLTEFGLRSEALNRLATIVRGADTNRLDLAPQSAGLLAASLGLSRAYRDDLEQLAASMLLYDAFYRWCRDAVGETHDWPTHNKKN
ncbi:MAG TPA: sulfurtransferase/chromate resistance protein [Dongiaceae bacterium]|jgi:rhodanese-related sulfurtransferase